MDNWPKVAKKLDFCRKSSIFVIENNRNLNINDMDFICTHCGKPHGVMTIVDGEMIHLACLREIESSESEIEEVILEE